jgi:hypothetical protein
VNYESYVSSDISEPEGPKETRLLAYRQTIEKQEMKAFNRCIYYLAFSQTAGGHEKPLSFRVWV